MKVITEYAHNAFGKLITVDGLFQATGIKCDRIMELVDCKLIPHVRVDNGEPLFRKQETVQWLKANLVQSYEGKPLPVQCIVSVDQPPSGPIPKVLSCMGDQLNEIAGMPFGPAIYFLLIGIRIMYVGQTRQLMARIGGHQWQGRVWERTLWMRCPAQNLDDVETWWIRHLDPPWNKQKDIHSEINPPQNLIGGDQR